MSAILFGSISTIADTSELQRHAFNLAFEDHGLQWRWSRDDYLAMLEKSGGRSRISEYADSVGATVDAPAIHATKSQLFQEMLRNGRVVPRPGVVETIKEAKDKGVRVGLVTTTSRENISALIEALAPHVQAGDFAVIVDASAVEQPKPDKAAYTFALQSLGEDQHECVAIEDNEDGARAAAAAGLRWVAFPNENTAGQSFASNGNRVDELKFDQLQAMIGSGAPPITDLRPH